MAKTRSQLEAARIIEVTKDGRNASLSVDCMFNPYEYTVAKSNAYSEKETNGKGTPAFQFKQAGPQSLKLTLIFDTYETGEDVSKTTVKLWEFMEPSRLYESKTKREPPYLAFEWGVFRFCAVITNMTQKFTLFKFDGTPVRAQVDVTFTQYDDKKDYKHQNPTSGGGPVQRIWSVVRGDRLDTIAAATYGDATQWRRIADHNNLRDPLALAPGQQLIIPEER